MADDIILNDLEEALKNSEYKLQTQIVKREAWEFRLQEQIKYMSTQIDQKFNQISDGLAAIQLQLQKMVGMKHDVGDAENDVGDAENEDHEKQIELVVGLDEHKVFDEMLQSDALAAIPLQLLPFTNPIVQFQPSPQTSQPRIQPSLQPTTVLIPKIEVPSMKITSKLQISSPTPLSSSPALLSPHFLPHKGKYALTKDLKIGGEHNTFVKTVNLIMYVKSGGIRCFVKIFKWVPKKNDIVWATNTQGRAENVYGGEKLFQLAEGLLKKHIASHGLHEPEALSVYIFLLEEQHKYSDALEILSGNLGSLMMIEVDKLRLQGRLLARAGDYAAAADVFQKVLALCPDDWECFLHYLGSLLEDDSMLVKESDSTHTTTSIDCKNLHISEELFDSRMSGAVNFTLKLMEANSNSERGPYLALLEIERQKLLFEKGDANKLVEDLMQYFIRFGHLACFTSDVEVFLQVLDNNKKSEFLKNLLKEHEATKIVPTKALGQSITVFKVQNLIGNIFALPVDELENMAVQMTQMFCKNLPLSKDLDAQESMYGEELLSMACNVMVQLFWRTRDLGYLVESIMILEFGLAIRRHVFQYKILLVHLYSYWSSLPSAYECYKSLDVKNILLETVSHHILPQMLASPLWPYLNNLLSDYLNFMDDHFRESADLTFLAYRHRNYSKVIEFVQFKERLQRSSQYLMAKIELPILQLKQNSINIDEDESILESLRCGTHFIDLSNEIRSKSLTFNDELNLRPWWTPTYDKNYLLGPFEGPSYCPRENMQNLMKQTEVAAVKKVEKRSLLPRMIYLSRYSASASVKENIEANGSVADPKLSLELKILLERYANILEFPFQDAVELVSGVSSGQKPLEAPSMEIIDWMNFAVFLNAWNLNSHEIGFSDRGDSGRSTWNLVNTLLRKYVVETIKSAGPIVSSPGSDLPFLVQLVTEPLAWHALIIQSCVRSLLPAGKKKKKGGSVEQSNSQLLSDIQNSIQSLCDTIEVVTKWLKEQLQTSHDGKFEAMFSSIQRNDGSNGPGKVFKIMESSVSVMKDAEVGDRVLEALHSWNPADVVRKIISGQEGLLASFLKICESRIKSLQALRHQL